MVADGGMLTLDVCSELSLEFTCGKKKTSVVYVLITHVTIAIGAQLFL